MCKKLVLVLIIAFACISVTFAQEYKNEFGFKTDNDAYLFNTQDRYYTNGLFVSFRRARDQQKLNERLEKVTYEFSLVHKMYNPYSGNSPDASRHDRPFAAHLFADAKVNFFSTKESVLKTSLNFGLIGPSSLGKETQELLHRVVGFYKIEGWDYQIKNTMAVNAAVQYVKLMYRSNDNIFDLSVDSYANLGTSNTGTGVALLFRTGNLNQLFNSTYHNANVSHNAKTKKLTHKEFYFYLKPQINYVAYNASIQGSLFNDDSEITFDVKPLVFDQTIGLAYSSDRFTVDYHLRFLTKEVKSDAKPHQYGSISLYYRFN